MTLQEPRFAPRTRASVTTCQTRLYNSPLYGSLPFSSFVKGTGADAQICTLLETLRDITDAAINGVSFCNLLANVKMPCPTDPIHKALHAAGQIYAGALSSPSSFTSALSLPWLQILATNLDCTVCTPFWRENPGIRLWALLVGTSASAEREERGFFMMYLARVSLHQDWEHELAFRIWSMLFSGVKRPNSQKRTILKGLLMKSKSMIAMHISKMEDSTLLARHPKLHRRS